MKFEISKFLFAAQLVLPLTPSDGSVSDRPEASRYTSLIAWPLTRPRVKAMCQGPFGEFTDFDGLGSTGRSSAKVHFNMTWSKGAPPPTRAVLNFIHTKTHGHS